MKSEHVAVGAYVLCCVAFVVLYKNHIDKMEANSPNADDIFKHIDRAVEQKIAEAQTAQKASEQ